MAEPKTLGKLKMSSEDHYHIAMINAYNHIVGKETIEEKLNRNPKDSELTGYPFHPEKVTKEDVQNVIDYWAELQEYEMCSKMLIKKSNLIN